MMKNKNKLRRRKIFFENDLSFEERKTRINKWVKAQKNKGEDIKIEYGRVKLRGIWKTWAEIGEEEKREKENNNRKYIGNIEEI